MARAFRPLSGRDFPRFSQNNSFFRLPHADPADAFDVALFGAPFDGGSSFRPGSRFAPAEVRRVSALGRAYNMGRQLDAFGAVACADVGDCATSPPSIERTHYQVQAFAADLIANGKRTLAVGGDHSLTLPLLRAWRSALGGPLGLVHFDAHFDTYPPAWECPIHHGAFLRNAIEEELVDPQRTVQIGIRGPLAGADDLEFARRHGLRVITVEDVRERPFSEIAEMLSVNGPAYLTYDVDCLDPAFAPGTGTPVPGGLTTYETQKLLRAVRAPQLVGADVMEVSPPYDVSDITALAAVDAMFEAICLMAACPNPFPLGTVPK